MLKPLGIFNIESFLLVFTKPLKIKVHRHSIYLCLKYSLKQVEDDAISKSEKEGIRNSGKVYSL